MRTLLCFGDSNTHGSLPMRFMGDRRRLSPAERWPGVMAAALGDGWRVVEEGHPGRTTVFPDPIEGAHKSGLAVLPSLLESHRPIDLVTVMLGTNDLKARFGLPAEDIAAAVDLILAAVLGSDSGPENRAPRALLIAPAPVEETGCLAAMFTGGAAKGRRLGALYEEKAKARGVPFLDAGQVIAVSPVDGVHFGAEQHAALGRAVAEAVKAL